MSNQTISGDSASNVQQVHSVLNAVSILELFAARQQEFISLTDISRSLGLHKTTVYRILRTLQSVGWVEQSASNGQYRLGSGILLASSAAAARYSGRELIVEEMERLAEQFHEMVVLAMARDGAGICVDLVKSKYNLSMVTSVGYPVPFHAGATGKTLLSAQPDETVQRFLDTLPPQQATDLRAQVADIRTQGYCHSESEVDKGAAAVAVPLRTGEDIYVLSISGPAERLRPLGYDVLRDALLSAVRRIQRKSEALSSHGR